MAGMGLTQDSVLDFLRQRGGRVKNSELAAFFKAAVPEDARDGAAARLEFKGFVDTVAVVRTEGGEKHVCLRKRFRACPEGAPEPDRYAARQVSADDAAPPPASPRARQRAPGSGYGNDSNKVPHIFGTEGVFCAVPEQKRAEREFASGPAEAVGRGMGNRESSGPKKRDSGRLGVPDAPPHIAVIEASPLPQEGSAFHLPEPEPTQRVQAGLLPAEGTPLRHEESDSLSGSDDGTSRVSRRRFLEVMMNTSPQVRRSLARRGSFQLSDSDSASLASVNMEDDGPAVTLDPLEHEWMLCASDGEWSSLQRLLDSEPSLLLKKDFVTGFTCLHWAAKHGRPELIALIMNFARDRGVCVDVDVRSSTGYTPLHIAAMHGHTEAVKLLVGAYCADVDARDYSGRKACQYLTSRASRDIKDLAGAQEDAVPKRGGEGGHWSFSKALHSNHWPPRLHLPDNWDSIAEEERPRQKPVRRRSSLSRMKPKLERLRVRTSQIFHSASFHDRDELDGSKNKPSGSRPKTHFFS